MRLIDADNLIPIMKYTTTDNEIGVFPIRIGFNTIKRVIDEAPTIDAVEVVRCKDCYHAEDDTTHLFCVYFHNKVYEDDYCSNAVERKGGDDE